MREFMPLPKALSDENRIRIVMALARGELCVCQITELFGLSPSTTSKHLSILYQAGLTNSRKEGRWMYYSLPGREAPGAVREAIAWVKNALAENPKILEDASRLKKIQKTDPSELCKQQTK